MKTIQEIIAVGVSALIITSVTIVTIFYLLGISTNYSVNEPALPVILTSVLITCCFRVSIDIWRLKNKS